MITTSECETIAEFCPSFSADEIRRFKNMQARAREMVNTGRRVMHRMHLHSAIQLAEYAAKPKRPVIDLRDINRRRSAWRPKR